MLGHWGHLSHCKGHESGGKGREKRNVSYLETSENNRTAAKHEPAAPGDADELARINGEAGELEDLGMSGQMAETTTQPTTESCPWHPSVSLRRWEQEVGMVRLSRHHVAMRRAQRGE